MRRLSCKPDHDLFVCVCGVFLSSPSPRRSYEGSLAAARRSDGRERPAPDGSVGLFTLPAQRGAVSAVPSR